MSVQLDESPSPGAQPGPAQTSSPGRPEGNLPSRLLGLFLSSPTLRVSPTGPNHPPLWPQPLRARPTPLPDTPHLCKLPQTCLCVQAAGITPAPPSTRSTPIHPSRAPSGFASFARQSYHTCFRHLVSCGHTHHEGHRGWSSLNTTPAHGRCSLRRYGITTSSPFLHSGHASPPDWNSLMAGVVLFIVTCSVQTLMLFGCMDGPTDSQMGRWMEE